jgi:putative toxin-antitoxin system antitoxin component (TIGR02293 family)
MRSSAHLPRGNLPLGVSRSVADWARAVNRLVGKAARDEPGVGRRHRVAGLRGRAVLITVSDPSASDDALGYRMSGDVAERLVADGIDPDYLSGLAEESGIDPKDMLEFVGIDRTTVSRRKASGAALPQDAAVKALQATDLITQATEVFGSLGAAGEWLTKPHPSLGDEMPLQRARTPWGLSKVQSMLVALRYGGAA